MPDYRAIADEVAADITEGRLTVGTRLPPQRDFAFQRGIAVSSASRVYAELARRGLVSGEVGRGTFVRVAPGAPPPALSEPPLARVDLEYIFPILDEQPAALAAVLKDLIGGDQMAAALGPIGAAATPRAREIAAGFLAREGFTPAPAHVLFAGNGRQSIAAVLGALAAPGDRIGVEAITYPVVRGIAAQLGIELVPLALDEEGLVPEAILQAHASAPLRAVYLQPTLHNPLGRTMPNGRRAAVADALRKANVPAVEDAIYSFLADATPLAHFAPERTILVDSLSKRVAPGLTLGMIAAPPALVDPIARSIRSGAWSVAGVPLMLALALMESGRVAGFERAKRRDAGSRQQTAREVLGGLAIEGDERAYHLWLKLPPPWRAEAFTAAAARLGIAVTPGSAFAVAPGHAPRAVRISLASPPAFAIRDALESLRRLALADPALQYVD